MDFHLQYTAFLWRIQILTVSCVRFRYSFQFLKNGLNKPTSPLNSLAVSTPLDELIIKLDVFLFDIHFNRGFIIIIYFILFILLFF